MNDENTHNKKDENWCNWRAFVAGLILGVILALIWFYAEWGGVTLDGEDVSAQAAAALLAEQVGEDGDTLHIEKRTDEEGNTVIGLWVGEAPTIVAQITPPEDEEDLEEPTSTTTPSVNPGGESIKGPWDNPWWRGSDLPGENDPTPGVTKMYEIPIQGVGGGGSSSSSSGGDSGDSGPPGGGPGQEF